MMKGVLSCLVLCVLAINCFAQNLEDGWKDIKRFQTSKSTVDSLLGTPIIDSNGYNNYRTKEAFVQINYSSAPCGIDPKHPGIHRGRYNVPEATVLDMWVNLAQPVKVSELQLDLSKYKKDTSGDVLNVVYYYLAFKGFSISAQIRDGIEYAGRFEYRALEKDKKTYPCPE